MVIRSQSDCNQAVIPRLHVSDRLVSHQRVAAFHVVKRRDRHAPVALARDAPAILGRWDRHKVPPGSRCIARGRRAV